jgi:hypothetical protein
LKNQGKPDRQGDKKALCIKHDRIRDDKYTCIYCNVELIRTVSPYGLIYLYCWKCSWMKLIK